MAAMTVINRIVIYLVRIILITYGTIYLLGIFWHIGSIYPSDLMRGIFFSVSALLIGFLPSNPFNPSKSERRIYLGICGLGMITSVFLGTQYLFEEYRGISDVLEQGLLAGCFIFMLIQKRKMQGNGSS